MLRVDTGNAMIDLSGAEGRKFDEANAAFYRNVRDEASRISQETGRTVLVFVDGEEYARYSADVGKMEFVGIDYE